tara:strand:+ start:875 stop:1174 length:300 start_codon:yes stop_codon:yes gene_type:complete
MKKVVVGAFIIFSIYMGVFGGEYSVLQVRKIRQDQAVLKNQLDELKHENDSLKSWVQKLESDSATIERLARERYGMILPGEILYRVPEPRDSVENFQNR